MGLALCDFKCEPEFLITTRKYSLFKGGFCFNFTLPKFTFGCKTGCSDGFLSDVQPLRGRGRTVQDQRVYTLQVVFFAALSLVENEG